MDVGAQADELFVDIAAGDEQRGFGEEAFVTQGCVGEQLAQTCRELAELGFGGSFAELARFLRVMVAMRCMQARSSVARAAPSAVRAAWKRSSARSAAVRTAGGKSVWIELRRGCGGDYAGHAEDGSEVGLLLEVEGSGGLFRRGDVAREQGLVDLDRGRCSRLGEDQCELYVASADACPSGACAVVLRGRRSLAADVVRDRDGDG